MLERVTAKRARRGALRKAQAAALAICVLGATAGGFALLRSAFDADRSDVVQTPPLAANGQIVFATEGEDGRSHIFAARPDGSGARQITGDATNDTDPAVSPDGRTIAYVHELDQGISVIATIPIEGGTVSWQSPEAEMRVAEPTWSPDGTQIMYIGAGASSYELNVLDVNGRGTRQLVDQSEPLGSPSWSPDGEWIMFAAQEPDPPGTDAWQLWTMQVDGSDRLSLGWAGRGMIAGSWSPDGSEIAVLFSPDDAASGAGAEVWTTTPDLDGPFVSGGPPVAQLAIAVEASLEPHLAWAPDGKALLVSDGEWIYRVEATPEGDPRDNFAQLVEGRSPAWQPVPAEAVPSVTTSPEPSAEPSPSPSADSVGHDIGLPFRLCHLQPLGGIDFFGDGTNGKAWTGTKILEDGTCPDRYDDHYGVAVDYTGDGVADSWSGETIEYCGGCEPWKAMDLNGDGRKELMVIVEYFSIMHYGVYTFLDVDGRPEIEPFRIGEPGHPEHELDPRKPFTFWVGGDAGLSDWFHCETLPEFWLTGTESPIDPAPGAVKTVHRTHISLMTDGIAHILFADTYTVPAETHLELPYTSPYHSDPDCGIGVRPG